MKKVILSFLCVFYSILPAVYADDLLEQSFEPSKQNNQVVDLGNNQTAVWNAIFKQALWLDGIQQPLYVRIIKVILRWTLILGVTMGMIIGIRYIFVQWDEAAQKKLQWYLWNIIYWILIALASLTIVELIQSLTRSSVTF